MTVTDTAEGRHGHATATFSDCRTWRYTLTRRWADGPTVAFILLNPSTADAFTLDPTLTRAYSYARREGAGAMTVVNIFAVRATDPAVMKAHPEPVGADNDTAIVHAARSSDLIIAGWGAHGSHRHRDRHVLQLLDGHRLHRLGPTTKDGHPRHPLYLRADIELQPHP